MKLLAIDTSTESLHIAACNGTQLWQHSAAGGAQASATLLPAIMALLSDAQLELKALDAIAFGRGPGSFTGLRTACSVAQGLAYGAGGLAVLPIDTLLTIAEEARFVHGATNVIALLDARMDELYAARYHYDTALQQWLTGADLQIVSPDFFAQAHGADHADHAAPTDQATDPWQLATACLAGNVFTAYGARLPSGPARLALQPSAVAMLRLAPGLLASGQAVVAKDAMPLYIRDKVALTTAERMAAKAAQSQV